MEHKNYKEPIDRRLYRSVSFNQEIPFAVEPPFSKYLACFELGKEIELQNEDDEGNLKTGDECLCVRTSHFHDNGEPCDLEFGGISLRDSSTSHNSIPVCVLESCGILVQEWSQLSTRNPYFFCTKWISENEETELRMKAFNKVVKELNMNRAKSKLGSVKAVPYACYQLHQEHLNNDFTAFHDGGRCSKVASDHVTIYPAKKECAGCYLQIGTKSYLYCKDLLKDGWSPCCIRFCCFAQPRDLKECYDRDCYFGCVVLYDNWEVVIDYEECYAGGSPLYHGNI